ncbi:Ribophorin I [Serendipita vermifera]|nr:Ribophorin I [Serendipita vermifera]
MTILHWLLAASAAFTVNVAALATPLRTFENTNVQRTIELGGSLTHVTTTFAIKALGEGGPNIYTLALSELDQGRASMFDVKLKGSKENLKVNKFGPTSKSNAFLYTVELPAMAENATATLIVNSILSHASAPFPASIKQSDPQALKFTTEAYVMTPYHTLSERTKIRSPSPKIISYSTPSELTKYAASSSDSKEQAAGTKSGAVVTYGPFENIPGTTGTSFSDQQQLTIHYEYDQPLITVVTLDRWAEISHWGDNLNIQDNVHIRNDGAQLKGHFSRLEHQQAKYFNKAQPQLLTHIQLQLPAGIYDPYYYDSIGNVSTSRFRPAPKPSNKKRVSSALSFLELKPRYPLLGGWNYTYTLGWDAPLGDSAKYEKETGKYIVGIPFMTPIPGAAVDDASVTVVFPEGAENVEIFPPFEVESMSSTTHVTYLDTIGRPAITLKSSSLTDQHTGIIYASYTVPLRTHFVKPLAVATAMFGFFVLASFFRRVDLRIGAEKKKKTA